MHQIIIEGKFFTKQSVKQGLNNKKSKVFYDPDKQLKEEISAYIFAKKQYPKEPFRRAVNMDMYILRKLPITYQNKYITNIRREEIFSDVVPWNFRFDRDNVIKLYQDILNYGYLKNKIFIDDCQICDGRTMKLWTRGESKIIINLDNMDTQNLRIPKIVMEAMEK